MDWIQVATIIGVNIALFGGLASLIIWVVNKLDKDVDKIGSKMDAFERRMDAFERRMDGHAARIDQLYQMFVDLLKERSGRL
jgi:hypothetical protein